jgi:hypothetical protein
VGAERAEFIFFSLRGRLEAMRALGGEIVERAVYYPEDDQFLLDRTPTVDHWEVAAYEGVR